MIRLYVFDALDFSLDRILTRSTLLGVEHGVLKKSSQG